MKMERASASLLDIFRQQYRDPDVGIMATLDLTKGAIYRMALLVTGAVTVARCTSNSPHTFIA